jgi:hypothetical protein
MKVTKQMKLELEQSGLRHCNCCKKVKEIQDFYSKRMGHSDFPRCRTCRSHMNKKKINDDHQKYVDEKRNSEWFKKYLEKKGGKLKSTKNMHSVYKKMAYQTYFIMK